MGHADIGVTLNTYTHLGAEDAREELGKFAKMALKIYIQLKENLSEKVFSKIKKSRHFIKIFTKFG